MIRHQRRSVIHSDPLDGDAQPHQLAHEVPRHRVAVGVQRHDTVSGHDASQVLRGTERGSSTHRGQAFAFPFEALCGGFVQGSHEPDIGHCLQPTLQMAVEIPPAGEPPAGKGVVLDVADAAFHLALGAGAIGVAGPGLEPPVRRERQQPLIERGPVTGSPRSRHQRLGIVHQHGARHPAEVPEGAFHAVQPRPLGLILERRHELPPGIAQRGHEQMHRRAPAIHRHGHLTEIHLQLIPRRRLETPRRQLACPPPTAQRLHRPFHRAQLLADHVGVAAVTFEPLRQPRLVTRQPRPTRLGRLPAALVNGNLKCPTFVHFT